MKANELRIGNLVNHINMIIEIKSLHPKDDDVNDEIPFHSIFGIPITEEFKKEFGKNKNVLVDKSGFVIFKNGYAYQFVFEDYQFIHSMQNLYFALTNEELIIKTN